MDKKKIFAIAIFFLMGFFMFTFANPGDETKKINEETQEIEKETTDNTTNEETQNVPNETVVTPNVVTPVVPVFTTAPVLGTSNQTIGENIVVDTTKPVITLNGSDVIIRTTDKYNELGATATDNIDGNITNKIVISGTIENSKGNYVVSYDVTDASSNKADTITRNVTVVDVTELEKDIQDGNSILEETNDKEVSEELKKLLDELKDEIEKGNESIENKDTLQDTIDSNEKDIEETIEKIRNLEFTVTFYDWDASYHTEIVKYNETVSNMPEALNNKNGYTFDKWIGNYSNVMKNEELNAKYDIINYNISYIIDGTHSNRTEFTVEDTFDLEVPTKQGYTCSNWVDENNTEYTTISGVYSDLNLTSVCSANTDTKYTVEIVTQNINNDEYTLYDRHELQGTTDSIIDLETLKTTYLPSSDYVVGTVVGNNIKVKADGSTSITIPYNRVNYTLSFTTTGSSVESKQYRYGKEVSLTEFASSKLGYSFDGWNLNSQKEETITMDSDKNVESIFTTINYNITYNLNGGTLAEGTTNPETYTIEDTITFNNPTKQGYDFVNWTYSVDGVDVAITGLSAGTGDIELTANYTESTNTKYTVEVYKDDLIGNPVLASSNELSGTTNSSVSTTANSIDGFTYDSSRSTLSGNINADGSLVLKVYYSRNSYTITFDENGGSDVTDITAKYEDNVTLPTPTRDGYVFTGWGTDITKMPLNGVNLTANWQLENVVVTFENWDGSYIADQTISYNSKATDLTTKPTRSSDNENIYTFASWTVKNTEATFDFNTNVTSNITLVATYSAQSLADFMDNETPFKVVEIDHTWLDARLKDEYMNFESITPVYCNNNSDRDREQKCYDLNGVEYNINTYGNADMVIIYKKRNKCYLDSEYKQEINCRAVNRKNYTYAYTYYKIMNGDEGHKIDITVKYSNIDVLGNYASATNLASYNDLSSAYSRWDKDNVYKYKDYKGIEHDLNTSYHFHVTEYKNNYYGYNNTGNLLKYNYIYIEYTENNQKYILVYEKNTNEYTLVRRHIINS